MLFRTFALSLFLAVAATTGCAGGHAVMRGSVIMKIDPTTAHVCLGNGEYKVNDRVRLFNNVCTPAVGDRRPPICKKETVAEGTVTQLLDEHYSVVAFPAGTIFVEGNTVERL